MNDTNRETDADATTWNYAHAAVQRLTDEHRDDLVTDGGQLDLSEHIVDLNPDVVIDASTASVLLNLTDALLESQPDQHVAADLVDDARNELASSVESAHLKARQNATGFTQASEHADGIPGVQFSVNLGFLRNESPTAAKHLMAASYALAGNEHAKASRELKKAAHHIEGMAE